MQSILFRLVCVCVRCARSYATGECGLGISRHQTVCTKANVRHKIIHSAFIQLSNLYIMIVYGLSAAQTYKQQVNNVLICCSFIMCIATPSARRRCSHAAIQWTKMKIDEHYTIFLQRRANTLRPRIVGRLICEIFWTCVCVCVCASESPDWHTHISAHNRYAHRTSALI